MSNERIEQLQASFDKHEQWEDKYREIIKIGKSLADFPEEFQVEKYKIKGCQSQVWLYPKYIEGRVIFTAWSDAVLVKGIIAMLISVYSDMTPEEILELNTDFLSNLGVTDHLSMNRTNGLASMIKQIKMYAFVFKSLKDQGIMNKDSL